MEQSGEAFEAEVAEAVEAAEAGTPAVPARAVVGATLRAVVLIAVLFLAFALAPMNRSTATTAAVITMCGIGLAAFAVVFMRRLRAISRSPYPLVTGAEAIVEVLVVFVVLFALVHLAIADAYPFAYSEPLDRVDAVYFAVTVLTTVGFGDISPLSTFARVATTFQMLADLLVITAAARVFIGVARRSAARNRAVGQAGRTS